MIFKRHRKEGHFLEFSRNSLRRSKLTMKLPPPGDIVLFFVPESSVPRTYATVHNIHLPTFPTQGGFSLFWGAITCFTTTVEFSEALSRRPHLRHRKNCSDRIWRRGGSTTGVRGISRTVPTLLIPFLKEILRSHNTMGRGCRPTSCEALVAPTDSFLPPSPPPRRCALLSLYYVPALTDEPRTPFCGWICQSHTNQLFSGDPADF